MEKNRPHSTPSANNIKRYTKKLFSYLGFTAGILFVAPSLEAYNVTSALDTNAFGTLRYGIANAPSTGESIVFTIANNTITLTNNLPPISVPLTIDGGVGNTISGNSLYQPFFIQSGNVSISNLNLENCAAIGGNGGSGYGPVGSGLPGGGCGGGGLGAGGAIFINSTANVELNNVVINNSMAIGGNGGTYLTYPAAATIPGSGGGGGGLFFEGGSGLTSSSSSTNIGLGGGGGGGSYSPGDPGFSDSTGGTGGPLGGGDGGDGTGFNGSTAPTPGEAGQSYGGGGGGGGPSSTGAGGAPGGDGGFGGGGGGGAGVGLNINNEGGNGGYGGGGGGQGGDPDTPTQSTSAFGGGNGAFGYGIIPGGGGGGAGLGGGIFIYDGGTLTYTGNIGMSSNTVTGGTGSGASQALGGAGIASGKDIFLGGGSTVTISPSLGTTITLQQITSDNFSPSTFNVGGTGTVNLAGGGTFTGTVSVAHGSTLQLDAALTASPVTVDGTFNMTSGSSATEAIVNSDGVLNDSGTLTTAIVSGHLAVNTGGTVGTLTLNSGGTTTDSGTITTANVSGDLAVNTGGTVGTLTLNSGGTATDSGTITTATVSGNLTVNHGGTVNNLTVNSGGTTTNSGSITTAVDNGTMVVNSGGTVSTLTVGAGGSLTNSGTITTATSSGAFNNETGGVVGTLTLDAGNATNAGTVTTANINASSVLTDTGSIGTALVSGTLNISGTASNVTVNSGGIVSTSGMLGVVDILSGGLLKGTGTITNLTNDGTLVLGTNGAGLLTAGTYTQSANGILQDQIAANGSGGLLQVTGNANIDGTLQVNPLPGVYFAGVTYPVIQTGGQVVGTFSTFTSNSLPLSISYLSNAVLLTVPQTTIYGFSPVVKGNALQVLNNLLNVDYTNDPCLVNALSSLPFTSNTALTKALNELQPVLYQGLTLTTFENLVTVQQVLAGRSALFNQFPAKMQQSYYDKICSGTETAGFWVAPFGLLIDQNKLEGLRRYHANTYGAAIGIDNQFLPNTLGGMSVGFSQTNINWSGNTGKSSFQTGYLGLYTGGTLPCIDGMYFDASVLGSFERYHAERNIQFFHKKAKNKHSGYGFDGHMGIGYIHKDCLMWSEPYASVDYSFIQRDKFKEKGASCLDLHVRRNHTNMLRYELGVQFSKPMEYCSITILPAAYVSYVRRQVLDGNKFTASFKHQSRSFNVYGTRVGLDKLAGGASVNLLTYDGNLISIAYDVEYSKKRENSQSIIFTFEHMF